MVPDAGPIPPRDRLIRECWIAGLGILALLGFLKHLAALVPMIGDHAFTAAAAAQLYIPIMLIGRRGIDRAELGLVKEGWRREALIALLLGVATILPFAIGHHFWRTIVMRQRFAPRWPGAEQLDVATRWLVEALPAIADSGPAIAIVLAVLSAIAIEVLVIALPEELFFRGYLQRRLEHVWPARRRLFGAPFGLAIVVASLVFALAHFVGEYQLQRLGPFFPALLFGLLRSRRGSLVAPVIYHAFCNLLSQLLAGAYRW